MLRITKDTKYYGIDNIEKIITEIKSPTGFNINIGGTWGFYTKNFDEKTITDIVENFENACEEIDDCTGMNLINDVIIRHTIVNPLNPGTRLPTHIYHIGKYMVPERIGEEGHYLIIYIGLGESTFEISARMWEQQFGQDKLTAKAIEDNITIEQKKMNINDFLNLFKTIVDNNASIGCPTNSEYRDIVDRINNSTGLEPVYEDDVAFVESALKNLKNMPIAGADWIDWSKINDQITGKHWEYWEYNKCDTDTYYNAHNYNYDDVIFTLDIQNMLK